MADDVTVRLNGDNANYRSMLGDADAATASTFEHIERHLLGTRAVATAVGTALGLHLTEIAENVARIVTGVSKTEEDQLKALDTLSTQAADLAMKNMESRLSAEEKYQLALVKRGELEQALSLDVGESTQQQVQFQKDRIAFEQNIAVIQEYEKKQQEDAVKAQAEGNQLLDEESAKRSAIAQRLEQAQLASLTQAERQAVIQQEISDIQDAISRAEVGSTSQKNLQIELDAKTLDLTKEQAKAEQERSADQLKNAKQVQDVEAQWQKVQLDDVEQNYRYLILEAKGVQGLTEAEQAEFEVLKLGFSVLKNRYEIEQALLVPAADRTQAEKDHLRVLIAQGVSLQDQITAKKEIIAKTNDQATAEAGVTAQQKEQVTAATEFVAQLAAQAKELENIASAWDNAKIAVTQKSDGRDNTQLTDAELQAKINTLKSEIFNTNSSLGGNQWLKDILTSGEQGQADAAQQELNQRTVFRQQAAALGTDAALNLYSPFDQQRLKGYLGSATDSAKIASSLSQISLQLANSGLFPTGPQTVPPSG